MRIAVFSTKPYDRQALDEANAAHGHALAETTLANATAFARGQGALCAVTLDDLR